MSSQEPTTKTLLDYATEVAVAGKRERVSKTQIDSLLNFARESMDKNKLILYIMRQSTRTPSWPDTGKLLVKHIKELGSMDDIIRFLGYVKWIFESLKKIRVDSNTKTFDQLVSQFTTEGSTHGGPKRP